MRKIYLFCAAGMSTSVLVKKMQEYAKSIDYECEVVAHPIAEVGTYGPDADIVLLGPQVRYELDNVKSKLPADKPVESINMQDYGLMNGKNVIEHVKQVLGD